MTGLLIIIFVPVFNSYNSPDQKRIEAIEKEVGDQNKLADSTLKASLISINNDTAIAKNFLKEKTDILITQQIDSLSRLSTNSIYSSNIGTVKEIKTNIDQKDKEAKEFETSFRNI